MVDEPLFFFFAPNSSRLPAARPGAPRRAAGWLIAVAITLGTPSVGHSEMQILETPSLRMVHFDPTGAHLVPYATQCFLNALEAQRERFGYVPDDKVSVLLKDFSDRGTVGAVLGAPRNRIYMEISPPTLSFETFSPGERVFTDANHELVHMVTSDMSSPEDRRFRRWFSGKVVPVADHPESILYNYLTNPRATTPRWYVEGSAVFMETWFGGGYGRAQGGYDEMVFRAMARDEARFYDPLGLVSKGTEVDFQVGANAYLYGTRFMSYLAYRYGPQALVDWYRRGTGTRRYYSDDFERVFGLPLERAWEEWVEWEGEFQAKNLAAVRQHPLTPYRNVARTGLGALSRAFVNPDGRTLYAATRYPGRLPHVVSISLENGAVTELAEVRGAIQYRVTSLAYDPEAGTLFYTTNNMSYRNVMALDLASGETRTLLKGARIGDLAFNPADRSLWGLRTNNGFMILVRIPYPYREWKVVHVFPFTEVPFDLDVSPDGSMVSTSLAGLDASRAGAQVMQVRVMRTDALLAGDATPMRKLEFGHAVPEGFVFSPDGKFLFGSSYYTGVSNIYRYEIATGEIKAVSNAETGFFRPVPLSNGSLLVFNYTADGFVPATIPAQTTEDLSAITFLGERIATEHPVVQSWGAGSPARIDYSSQVERQGVYRPSRELYLESLYPIVEGYKDSAALGLHARFSDPIGFSTLGLTASYSPDGSLPSNERTHAAVQFERGLWNAGLKWNAGDFYDLFGPTKRSREGYSGYVEYDRPIIFDPPEELNFTAKLAHYGDLDSLPGFQNVASPSRRLNEAQFGLIHKNADASIGNVDDETGYKWSLLAHGYEADGEVVPALIGQFDAGLALTWGHSSIWVRSAAGRSWGDRTDPLANAFFGGFRNNYVDNGEVKRYRDVLAMPGFEIDEIGGRTFGKSMLELNLPPLRFENLGTPGFYASWARPALFATALVTNPDDDAFKRTDYNVGMQVDIRFQVMHRLPMTLSFGYAVGFADGARDEDEFMVSLKVL
jgi:sugar lactone lactonase YvrE